MKNFAMYIGHSLDLRNNFVEADATAIYYNNGNLHIQAGEAIEKLSPYLVTQEGAENLYAIPHDKVVQFSWNFKKAPEEKKAQAEDETISSMRVRPALKTLSSMGHFGNSALGKIAAIADDQKMDQGTLKEFLSSMTKDKWNSYAGVSTGIMKILESIYGVCGVKFN